MAPLLFMALLLPLCCSWPPEYLSWSTLGNPGLNSKTELLYTLITVNFYQFINFIKVANRDIQKYNANFIKLFNNNVRNKFFKNKLIIKTKKFKINKYNVKHYLKSLKVIFYIWK